MPRLPNYGAADPLELLLAQDPSIFGGGDPTDAMLGLEPPVLDTTQEPGYQGGGFNSFLQGMGGLENTPMPSPRNFGEGLVSGFSRGIGRAGTRAQSERAKFETLALERQRTRNAANLEATRDYRKERGAALKDLTKSQRDAKTKQTEYERDNPVVDDALIAKYPGLSALPRMKGQRIEQSMLNRQALEEPGRTAAAARAGAAGDRAAAAADRSAQAADRSNRLATVNSASKLIDDYRLDPAVKGYQNVRSNVNTAEAAAKLGNGPGDIAIVFSFMRALEPENPNAVREGEYSNARKAAGLFQQVKNLPSKYFAGTQLTPEGRQFFLKTMRAQLQSRRPDYDMANDQYRQRSAAFGVDPTLFVRDFPAGSAGNRARPPLQSFERP